MIQCKLMSRLMSPLKVLRSIPWHCSQIGLAFFVIGSAICTGAQSLPVLLAGRGISGIGAAGLISVSRVISSDSQSIQENTFVNALLVAMYTAGFSSG